MSFISFIFLGIGIFFIGLSVLGLIKMKDLLLRVQVASKASTLGLLFCLLAVVLKDPQAGTVAKVLLTTVFLFLTTPIAAQAMSKLGHHRNSDELHLKLDDLSEDLKK